MGRLRELMGSAARGTGESNPTRRRADALSDAALVVKRRADMLIEEQGSRERMLAGLAAVGGLLAGMLGLAAFTRLGHPQLLLGLAVVALLAPAIFNVAQAATSVSRVAEASYERGLCQGLAQQARRLSDALDPSQAPTLPHDCEGLVNGQIDVMYRDLDRSRQRLSDLAPDSTAGRLHERLVPAVRDTVLVGSDGRRYPVRIVDVSQSGVAVRGRLPPLDLGEETQVGARRARVVKVAPNETALRFISPILPSEFNRRIIL